jgi:hypothetical protein
MTIQEYGKERNECNALLKLVHLFTEVLFVNSGILHSVVWNVSNKITVSPSAYGPSISNSTQSISLKFGLENLREALLNKFNFI